MKRYYCAEHQVRKSPYGLAALSRCSNFGFLDFFWIFAIGFFLWLTGRRQRVVINGVSSSWGNVISGVLQGSVLGPLLFLIYINDIDNDLFSKICKFADDTKIGRAVATEDDVQLLRDDLKTLAKWAIDWQCCLM